MRRERRACSALREWVASSFAPSDVCVAAWKGRGTRVTIVSVVKLLQEGRQQLEVFEAVKILLFDSWLSLPAHAREVCPLLGDSASKVWR